MVTHLADAPLGHLADDTNGLAVEALVTCSSDDAHIAHLAVNTDNETAEDTALDSVLIGVIGIFTGFVDEINQGTLATGELGLNVHTVILIDYRVGLLGLGVDRSDVTNLSCQRQHSRKSQQCQ